MKCKHCNTEFSIEKRAHICLNTRSIRGEMVGTLTLYQPSITKPNKQSTQPGYMKRFGSRATKG